MLKLSKVKLDGDVFCILIFLVGRFGIMLGYHNYFVEVIVVELLACFMEKMEWMWGSVFEIDFPNIPFFFQFLYFLFLHIFCFIFYFFKKIFKKKNKIFKIFEILFFSKLIIYI